MISLRNAKNLFNLQEFDKWRASNQFEKTMKLAESHNSSYDKSWKSLLNDRNNYQWSKEDQSKVISQLERSLDLNFIHTVVGFKLQDIMQAKNDSSLKNFEPKLLRGILYLHGAQNSEEKLIYNPNNSINWASIYDKFDNSNVDELRNLVANNK